MSARLAVLLFCLPFVAVGLTRADEPEEGFVPLLNGNDLEGWVVIGRPEGWQVQNGVLRCESGKNAFWIRSEQQYADFVLRVEWRVSEGGNSGVFIRVPEEGLPWQAGYEIQISHQAQDAKHSTGSLYSYAPVLKPVPTEEHQWHTFEIRCRGPKIQVAVDEVLVIDVDQNELAAPTEPGYTDPKQKPLKGYIGLQGSHAPLGTYVEYRNIRIQELQ